MKHIISLQFQSATEGQRPTDEAINREDITTDNLGNIPSVGDYVCFDNENEEELVYRIQSRLFEYKFKNDNCCIRANIVVVEQPIETYNKLIKQ